MATVAQKSGSARPWTPDLYERFLAIGAILLLACVVAAVARGHADWGQVPPIVWAHLATIVIALALTPVILLGARGTQRHRLLGRIWAGSMMLTALLSLFVRLSNHGHFSLIHLLSVFTLVQVPLIVWSARTHRVARHRQSVRAMVTGALLIAGFFTFPFHRLLGQWLFG